MTFPIKTTLLLAVLLAQVGCATKQHRGLAPVPMVPDRKPTVIGNVSLVNSKVGFVLIKSKGIPPAGTILKSLSPEEKETATLKVTFERQPPFIIADIIKGSPYPGQPVIVAEMPRNAPAPGPVGPIRPTPAPPSAPVAPAPAPVVPVQQVESGGVEVPAADFAPVEAEIPADVPADGLPIH